MPFAGPLPATVTAARGDVVVKTDSTRWQPAPVDDAQLQGSPSSCCGSSRLSSGRVNTPSSPLDPDETKASCSDSASVLTIALEAVSREGGTTYSDDLCSVCLEQYVRGEELLQLTCCHVFHCSCIELWLKEHSVCPCCRCLPCRGGADIRGRHGLPSQGSACFSRWCSSL